MDLLFVTHIFQENLIFYLCNFFSYNVQILHLLQRPFDSWTKTIRKVAKDVVHRIFNGLEDGNFVKNHYGKYILAQSICTHYSCFENQGRFVTLKKNCASCFLKKAGSLIF